MNREVHARICGGVGVRFPCATRPKYKYQAAKIPAILDFNHRYSKLEMTVDYVDGFRYPYSICNILRNYDIWVSLNKSAIS